MEARGMERQAGQGEDRAKGREVWRSRVARYFITDVWDNEPNG